MAYRTLTLLALIFLRLSCRSIAGVELSSDRFKDSWDPIYSTQKDTAERLVFRNGRPAYLLPPVSLPPSFDMDWTTAPFGRLNIYGTDLTLVDEYVITKFGKSREQKLFHYRIGEDGAYISDDGLNFLPMQISILNEGGVFLKNGIRYQRWYQLKVSCKFFSQVFELADGDSFHKH